MTTEYDHLKGRPFIHGKVDCYTVVRDFYRDVFGIELTDYARADDWWDNGQNLYMDHYEAEGFVSIEFNPMGMQYGDLLISAIISPVPNHAAVWVGQGLVLHHLPNRLSKTDPFSGVLRNRLCAVLRHKDLLDGSHPVLQRHRA